MERRERRHIYKTADTRQGFPAAVGFAYVASDADRTVEDRTVDMYRRRASGQAEDLRPPPRRPRFNGGC